MNERINNLSNGNNIDTQGCSKGMENYHNFTTALNSITNLGNHEILLENFDEMMDDLSNLTDNGYISEDSPRYQILTAQINIVKDALSKPTRGISEISNSYNAYKVYFDMSKGIKNKVDQITNNGGDSDV